MSYFPSKFSLHGSHCLKFEIQSEIIVTSQGFTICFSYFKESGEEQNVNPWPAKMEGDKHEYKIITIKKKIE